MTETEASRAPASQETRLVFWMCVLISVGAFYIWHAGLKSPWDRVGVPIMSLLYGLIATGLQLRPRWMNRIMLVGIVPTSVYLLGGIYFASLDDSLKGLYALASSSQFMTLFYVEAFVALRQGAALVCWLHYAGLLIAYVIRYGAVPSSALPPQAAMNAHVWMVLLVAQPACIVALHYITALKGRLRATELASHQSKERFLAMLSHEIRSPLQAMLGSIDLLALKAQTPPERRAVDRIRTAASQLDTHLRDVTEYTRLENPAWQLQTASVDLPALAQEVCDTYLPQAQSKRLDIVCEWPQQDALALHDVWTDGGRVRQILSNLITNALKYTVNGRITVRVSLDNTDGATARIEVIDTGIGIPPPDQQRIFEPYVRLDDQRAGNVEGSGLGLAVVKRLVERLGGEVSLRSEVGQGSCFSVSLPLSA